MAAVEGSLSVFVPAAHIAAVEMIEHAPQAKNTSVRITYRGIDCVARQLTIGRMQLWAFDGKRLFSDIEVARRSANSAAATEG